MTRAYLQGLFFGLIIGFSGAGLVQLLVTR